MHKTIILLVLCVYEIWYLTFKGRDNESEWHWGAEENIWT